MFKHFLLIARRNLLKRKFYSFINIIGLAIGMTCCILIALYVENELSYDRYNTKHDHIYRVAQTFRSFEKGQKVTTPLPEDYQVWGCAPVGPALAADFPQVKDVVQFMSPVSLLLEFGDKRLQQENLVCIDSTAFKVFSWKLLYGNPQTALVAPNSIVLTQKVAEKFFGNDNPVGKSLRVNNGDNFTVTGVVADVPANSQINFNGLISMTTARKWREDIFNYWGYVDFYTYFVLKDHADIAAMKAGIPAFIKRHNSEDPGYTIAFEKMDDAYLYSKAARQPGPVGSMSNIYLFCCIGIIILIIACVNFMNLSTARSLERAKEVGVRKVMGVQPSALRWQFLFESLLISTVAAVLAVVLTKFSLPLVSALSGKDFTPKEFFNFQLFIWMVGLTLTTGLLAGVYPAWFLSRFQPVEVLKGVFRPSVNSISLRKALVIFQFTLSITLIAGTAIVYTELKFLNNHDLGFAKDQMLVLNFEGDEQVQKNIERIKKSLADQPGVLSVAASRAVPGEFLPNAGTDIQGPDGQMKNKIPLIYEIDFDFIKTLQIPLVAGRNYSRAFLTDSTQSMVINEAAAKMYGYRHPADAVGKKFAQWGRQGTIIGVVKNFNFRSLHTEVEPLTLRYGMPDMLNRILVAVKADHISATIAALEKTWKTEAPQRPFLYHFLDESFNKQYESDQHFGYLFSLFSCLASLIACLGLFGLATFTAQQRIKEIGIRKVLGASVSNIVVLISKDFMRLVLIAIVIAIPLCLLIMNQWLKDFAYRITISPGIFIATAAISILIALVTISWQTVRAALANPVPSIKNE
ncbi:ABC transporter permease [Mucilaginibacter agri]|uniref:FtsX-like permease family protein n=1 Tax=Mucilaginibacter agri TaxID=2695265 RepID=A0A966DV51_9SPHI|nr:ABC transporter permease [Mucilaginibacter agri]NCD71126.1 FtsX-like permease family protein [Mucilaginibacter agri]